MTKCNFIFATAINCRKSIASLRSNAFTMTLFLTVAMFFLAPILGGVGGGFLTGGAGVGFAQNVGINSTGAAPDNSSVLDIAADGATKGGLLIPRVSLTSTTDVSTIASPANSLMVYNTNAAMLNGNGVGFYYYSTSAVKWIYVDAAANGPGTAGQVLTSQGPGSQPTYTAITGGGGATGCASCITETAIGTTGTWSVCRNSCVAMGAGWRMPTWDEELNIGSGALGTPTGGWIANYVWTSTNTRYDITGSTTPYNNWLVLAESTGFWNWNTSNDSYGCRCVR